MVDLEWFLNIIFHRLTFQPCLYVIQDLHSLLAPEDSLKYPGPGVQINDLLNSGKIMVLIMIFRIMMGNAIRSQYFFLLSWRSPSEDVVWKEGFTYSNDLIIWKAGFIQFLTWSMWKDLFTNQGLYMYYNTGRYEEQIDGYTAFIPAFLPYSPTFNVIFTGSSLRRFEEQRLFQGWYGLYKTRLGVTLSIMPDIFHHHRKMSDFFWITWKNLSQKRKPFLHW